MSNRKNQQRTKRRQAPVDPGAVLAEGGLPVSPQGLGHWLVAGLKVSLGSALILGAVFGISWGVYRYVRTTPRFSLAEIRIEGTKRLAREDILAASGLLIGANLFSLDVEAAQAKLAGSPWIERARITRRLPNRILVEVHERDARATLVLDGKSFLVDENGVPFKEAGTGDPHDLPLLTGVTIDEIAEGRELEQERLRDAIGLIRSYEHLPVAKNYPPEEVHLDPSGSATLIVGTTGTALYLGRPPFKQRLLRAERVLSKTMRKGAAPSVVFLDNEAHPERVVVRVQ